MANITLHTILSEYKLAATYWQFKIAGITTSKCTKNDEDILKHIDAYKSIKEGGAIIKNKKGVLIDVEAMRNNLWAHASKSLEDTYKQHTEWKNKQTN